MTLRIIQSNIRSNISISQIRKTDQTARCLTLLSSFFPAHLLPPRLSRLSLPTRKQREACTREEHPFPPSSAKPARSPGPLSNFHLLQEAPSELPSSKSEAQLLSCHRSALVSKHLGGGTWDNQRTFLSQSE